MVVGGQKRPVTLVVSDQQKSDDGVLYLGDGVKYSRTEFFQNEVKVGWSLPDRRYVSLGHQIIATYVVHGHGWRPPTRAKSIFSERGGQQDITPDARIGNSFGSSY